jgi:hypothetical protein
VLAQSIGERGIPLFHDARRRRRHAGAVVGALKKVATTAWCTSFRKPAIGYRARAMTEVRHYRVVWSQSGLMQKSSH